MRCLQITSVAILIAALYGCGGGGGGTASSPVTQTVSGIAIDGYLNKATVFLDLNDNGVYDTGEPTSETNSSGSYSFSATADQISAHAVVVLAKAGVTIDQDNPNTPISSSYSMSAPVGKPDVVSPITTLIAAKISTGLSADQALSAVKTDLGFTSSDNVDLYKNYVKEKETDSNYQKIHNLAAATAEALKSAESSTGSTLKEKLAAAQTAFTSTIANNISQIKSATSTTAAANVVASSSSSSSSSSSVGGASSSGFAMNNFANYKYFVFTEKTDSKSAYPQGIIGFKSNQFKMFDNDFEWVAGSYSTTDSSVSLKVTSISVPDATLNYPATPQSSQCAVSFGSINPFAASEGLGFRSVANFEASCSDTGQASTESWSFAAIDDATKLADFSGKKLTLDLAKIGCGDVTFTFGSSTSSSLSATVSTTSTDSTCKKGLTIDSATFGPAKDPSGTEASGLFILQGSYGFNYKASIFLAKIANTTNFGMFYGANFDPASASSQSANPDNSKWHFYKAVGASYTLK